MLHVELDRNESIAILEPEGALNEADFARIGELIDPYIEEHGKLNGLIIRAGHFPGWDSFSALVTHIRFVRNHHTRINKVALVTNSSIGHLLEALARHFVSAEVRHFPFGQYDVAHNWIVCAETG